MSTQPIIVIGMHRSGTSLATALLQSAGLDVGDRLMEGNWSNPRGHFEDMDFIEFHRLELVRFGLHQDGWMISSLPGLPDDLIDRGRALLEAKQRSGRPWGWKDPRTVLFLPLWSRLVPGATYAIVYRAPWEVIESLYRRGDPILENDPELAIHLWHSYNRVLLQLATAKPDHVVLVNVETMIADPDGWVKLVASRSGLPLGTPQTSIYEPSLLHGDEARERAGLVLRHYPDVAELYGALERLAYRPRELDNGRAVPEAASADVQRRRAMQDWHDLAGALAERDRVRADLLIVTRALDRSEPAVAEARRTVSKALSRLDGPVGQDLWRV